MKPCPFTLYLLLATLCACTESDVSEITPPEVSAPINWKVVTIKGTRALIENDTQLQTACTPSIGGEAITIWGSHNRSDEPIFNGTLLTYEAKTSTTPHMWNYVGEPDKYWLYSTKYDFLAYYPADFPNVVATSTSFTATYNSMVQQEDLMLARTTVNTADAAFDKYAPVPLQMNHALAAVKFKVKSEDGRKMTLKSLSLSGLYTKGDFVYQSKSKPAVTDWANHSGNTASYDWTGTLTFGGTAADVTGYTGASPLTQYAEDGFILVIPQQNCTPALDIATTDKVYDRAVLGEVDFELGKQYVYTITVTPADALKVTLRIKPWNELNSSYDITF